MDGGVGGGGNEKVTERETAAREAVCGFFPAALPRSLRPSPPPPPSFCAFSFLIIHLLCMHTNKAPGAAAVIPNFWGGGFEERERRELDHGGGKSDSSSFPALPRFISGRDFTSLYPLSEGELSISKTGKSWGGGGVTRNGKYGEKKRNTKNSLFSLSSHLSLFSLLFLSLLSFSLLTAPPRPRQQRSPQEQEHSRSPSPADRHRRRL